MRQLARREALEDDALIEVCGHCTTRVAAFRALDEALDGSPPVAARPPEPRWGLHHTTLERGQ